MTDRATITGATPTSALASPWGHEGSATVDLRSLTSPRPAALPQGRRLQIAWDPATKDYRLAMSP